MKNTYQTPECLILQVWPSEILCHSTDWFIVDPEDDVEF